MPTLELGSDRSVRKAVAVMTMTRCFGRRTRPYSVAKGNRTGRSGQIVTAQKDPTTQAQSGTRVMVKILEN